MSWKNKYEISESEYKFDIEEHKKKHIDISVAIKQDGTIEYAKPSHCIYCEDILEDKLRLSGDDLSKYLCDKYKDKYFGDYYSQLAEEVGVILVFQNGFIGNANKKQINSLRKLKVSGLYKGSFKSLTIEEYVEGR